MEFPSTCSDSVSFLPGPRPLGREQRAPVERRLGRSIEVSAQLLLEMIGPPLNRIRRVQHARSDSEILFRAVRWRSQLFISRQAELMCGLLNPSHTVS